MTLRVKLRYADLPSFIEKFAVNVGRVGMFLPTRALQPVGTELRFELRLLDDQVALAGMGRVYSVHEPAVGDAQAAHGMAIEFQRMTRESRDLVMQILEFRRAHGLGEPALPTPGVTAREAPAAAAPAAPAAAAAAQTPAEAAPVAHAAPAAGAPVQAAEAPVQADEAKAAPIAEAPTPAPPRPSAAPASLTAEPPRPRRRRLSELMAPPPEAASPAPGDPEAELAEPPVDMGRARARARAIARAAADTELTELMQGGAVASVDVAAASAELARQLGGAAVSAGRARRELGPLSSAPAPSLAEARTTPPTPTVLPAPPPSAPTWPNASAPAIHPAPSEPALAPAAPPTSAPASDAQRGQTASDEDLPEAPQRRRPVSRPPRLTRPSSVFARRTTAVPPPPIEELAEPSSALAAEPVTEPAAEPPRVPSSLPLPEEPTPPSGPAPAMVDAPAGFERVLAELEHSERGFTLPEPEASGEPGAHGAHGAHGAQAVAPTLVPPLDDPDTLPPPLPRAKAVVLEFDDPLDRLALDDLDDAGEFRDLTTPPSDPWRAPDELDLGTLGEAGFEILAEEDLDQAVAMEVERAPKQRLSPAEEALLAALDEPSISGVSGVTVPTWRRTTGFDPLDAAPDTAHSLDLAPPTIPGRIPTREIDLESALEALDLDADGPTTPGRPGANVRRPPASIAAARIFPQRSVPKPAPAPAPAPAPQPQPAPQSAPDDDFEDVPIELEFEDP